MTYGKFGALALVGIGLIGAAPGPTNLADLKVLRDIKPGLWSHSFTTTPKNPGVPNKQEKACVSGAQMQGMLRQSLSVGAQDQMCPMSIESDGVSKASFTLHCPPITIAQLGIKAPGAVMPGDIVRSTGEEHWVASVRTPGVPGVTPAATWRHDYRRLGDCPG